MSSLGAICARWAGIARGLGWRFEFDTPFSSGEKVPEGRMRGQISKRRHDPKDFIPSSEAFGPTFSLWEKRTQPKLPTDNRVLSKSAIFL